MSQVIRFVAVVSVLGAVLAGCSKTEDGVASGPAQAGSGSAGSASLVAASGAPTVLVLDSSGSMAEEEGSGTRMDAAQTAATGLVDALPDDAVLGLVAYGTSTGSSAAEKPAGCADVKTMRDAVALDRSAVTAAIRGLTPSGYTPIGASLRQAADLLPMQGDSAIVLLSDGEDTCAPPAPCDVARELKAQRPGLTISTVGFKTANDELACIAQATGGLYLTADNTEQLVSRLAAARDVSGNASALTPTGFQGIELGQGIDAIAAAHAGFPPLAGGRADGPRVIVVWEDCEWVFEGGVLTEIRPQAAGTAGGLRTVDGLAAGAPISKAVGLYGEAISKAANPDGSTTSLFPASKEAGTGWKIAHKDETITTIYLCKCLPKGESAGGKPSGDEVIGATTVKRLNAYQADGSLRSGVAAVAGYEFGCKPMLAANTAEGLSACGRYQTDGTTYFCSQSQGQAICPVLDAKAFSGAPGFVTGPVAFSGTAYGPSVAGVLPWAIELADGTACQFGTAMGAMREGVVSAYNCGPDGMLWAPQDGAIITVTGSGWTVQSGSPGTGPLRTATVKTAVFLTKG